MSEMNGASDLCNFAALSGAVCMSSNGHLQSWSLNDELDRGT